MPAAGQVHTRPFLDLQKPERRCQALDSSRKKSRMSPGTGRTPPSAASMRPAWPELPWVARQYGPLYPIFRQVKAIFDPKNLFNPGKIVDSDPKLLRVRLRSAGAAPLACPCLSIGKTRSRSRSESLQWMWPVPHRIAQQRMCPMFRATHGEEASPRARANLLRLFLGSP